MRSFVLVLATLQVFGHVEAQSPVAEVIQMLTDMQATGSEERATEQDIYEKYASFVRLRTAELEQEITIAKAKIEELIVTIEKAEADIEVLKGQLAANEAQTGELEANLNAARVLRDSEHAKFLDEQTSYTESVDALDGAVQMVGQNFYRPQAEALLQRMAKNGTKGMRRVLAEFELLQVAQNATGMTDGAPAVAAYDSQACTFHDQRDQCFGLANNLKASTVAECQSDCCGDPECIIWQYHGPDDSGSCWMGTSDRCSGGTTWSFGGMKQSTKVLEMLKELHMRFRDELGALQKEEMNSAAAFEVSSIHMSNTLKNLKKDHALMTENNAKIAAESAAAKDELGEEKSHLAEAEGFLKEVTSTFAAKQATYKENQEVRKDELAAIGKAIEILSQPDLAGSYATQINALQTPVASSRGAPVFLQTLATKATVKESAKLGREALRESTARYLRGKSAALKSKTLAMVAHELAENPFEKVTDLIQTLLERLKEDAASEADHKAFCDDELRKNKMKRKDGEATAKILRSEIDEKAMRIVEMGKDITVLSREQAFLQTALAEATETRTTEKAENLIAIKDAQKGLVALKQAIAALKEFYGKGSFLQLKKQVPEMAEYKGMHPKNVGVTGMLEVIQTDFIRLETDTKAGEDAAAAEYIRFEQETTDAIESKRNVELKLSLRKDQTEFEQSQLEKDLDATLEQLKMANLYFEELKPQCVEVDVSFKERAARRQEEIEALQQSYDALDSRGE